MDRTLYLSEARGLQVLRDGPSLWIIQPGQAGRRIPVRLIGRVVIIGNVKIEAGVVTLFTDNGVPVTFMNRRGENAAVTLPYNHQMPRNHDDQKIFLSSDRMAQRYRQWALSKRRQVQLGVVKRLSREAFDDFRSNGMRERDYEAFMKTRTPDDTRKWAPVVGVVSQLFREMVGACVMRADLDPHAGIIHRRNNFGFVLDLCHILGPEADLQASQFFTSSAAAQGLASHRSGWSVTKEGMKDIIHRFENRREALGNAVERILDDFFVLIREVKS